MAVKLHMGSMSDLQSDPCTTCNVLRVEHDMSTEAPLVVSRKHQQSQQNVRHLIRTSFCFAALQHINSLSNQKA